MLPQQSQSGMKGTNTSLLVPLSIVIHEAPQSLPLASINFDQLQCLLTSPV